MAHSVATSTRAPVKGKGAPSKAAKAAPVALDHWAATLAVYATLAGSDRVQVVKGECPWAPTAKGKRIWALISAAKGGLTMAQLYEAAKAKHGIGSALAGKDVAWLYTWAAYPRSCTPGLVVTLNGKPYAPGAPKAAPKGKGKAPKAAQPKAEPKAAQPEPAPASA